MLRFFKELCIGCFMMGLGYFALLSFWLGTLQVAEAIIPYLYPHYMVAMGMALGFTFFLAYLVGRYLNRND